MNWRFWHRWVSVAIALPFAVILLSGLLLASRDLLPWVQPVYPGVSGQGLTISFPQILAAVQSVPEAGMRSWDDVLLIDVRPKNGRIRVRSKRDYWEVQIDGSTGAVMGAGKRRVAWISALHEGSFFGESVRYGLFVPSALALVFLLGSGLVIFVLPYFRKWKARHAAR